MAMSKKVTLTPVSYKAMKRGARPRNAIVERVEGDRMFVKFEGWNYWTWVNKKKDPNYKVKRGWNKSGSTYMDLAKDVYVR